MLKIIPQLTRARRYEVFDYLDEIITDNSQSAEAHLIAFRNGLFDISTDMFIPFSPDHIILNRIDWDYNPNAKSEIVDDVLDKWSCNDKQIRAVIEESLGLPMYRSNKLGKAFVLVGEKDNGKSTFLDTVGNLLGENNIFALDLKELNDKFKTAELFGKLANIGDDISDEFIVDPSKFKKLVTGEYVEAERKGQDPFQFRSYAKLFFSANTIPRIRDHTGAVTKRLLIIPFNARFTPDDPDFDPYIESKLQNQQCMEYLIQLGIQGLKRVLKNNRFSESTKIKAELDEYDRENNPVKAFVDEFGIENIENEPTDIIYGAFEGYCIKNGFKGVLNKINFSKQLKIHFGLVTKSATVKGKSIRIYVQQ